MASVEDDAGRTTDQIDPRLQTFDHVVVLMLENRSFDNLLGFAYSGEYRSQLPPGRTFNGVSRDFSNPVPADATDQPPDGSGQVFVSGAGKYHQPYPDPGEEYDHVTRQLFYDLDKGLGDKVTMQGFVADYIDKLGEKVSHPSGPPSYKKYSQIMQCFEPEKVPVLSTLAREFGVFDHWFCAVPSQTWCNRAFWHAGTSWGRVNNEPYLSWFEHPQSDTILNQISAAQCPDLDWKVYHGTPFVALTNIIHFPKMVEHESHFHGLDRFFEDCKNGGLPAYSFVEPDFLIEHNDYHPSSAGLGLVDYWTWPGTVLLGERLVARVYDAIRKSTGRKDGSGSNSQNTLLIITFDEHGGCFDHVPPLEGIEPPDLQGYTPEQGFDFRRSGIRVPTIMVSAHIERNTVINSPMLHSSFLDTVQEKWRRIAGEGTFPQLSKRQESARQFVDVFTAKEPRPASDWPEIKLPRIPCIFDRKRSNHALEDLGRSIVGGTHEMLRARDIVHDPRGVETRDDALEYLRRARDLLDQAS